MTKTELVKIRQRKLLIESATNNLAHEIGHLIVLRCLEQGWDSPNADTIPDEFKKIRKFHHDRVNALGTHLKLSMEEKDKMSDEVKLLAETKIIRPFLDSDNGKGVKDWFLWVFKKHYKSITFIFGF